MYVRGYTRDKEHYNDESSNGTARQSLENKISKYERLINGIFNSSGISNNPFKKNVLIFV